MIRNGAKGISVFMLILRFELLEMNIRERLTIVPIQKATMTAKIPDQRPRRKPTPSNNLPSPKPIKRPLEKNQRSTNGKAMTGPASRLESVGIMKKDPIGEKFINIERKERRIKR